MNALQPQIIIDKNGHTKTVWVSPNNAANGILASNRNQVLSTPPQSRMAKVTLTSTDIENWIERNSLPLSADEDFVDLVNANIVASGDFSDKNFRDVYDRVFIQNFGGYTVDSLRAALGTAKPIELVRSNDQRVQNGEVFDRVHHNGVTYHRQRAGVYPSDVYNMRFQFSRALDVESAKRARDLIAYAWAERVRGEPLSEEVQDSPSSIIIDGDSTKSASSDVGRALKEWEEKVRDYVQNGVHRTNGANIEGLGSGVTLEFYYDNVGTF